MYHYPLKTNFIFIIIFILLGLFLPLNSFANQEIVIVRGQNFPPYHYIDENGKEKGFVIEIILGTIRNMELKVSFEQYPWSRCINLVKKGGADAMMNLFKTKERELFMHFENNIIAYETNSLFILADNKIDYNGDLSALRSQRFGTIRNYSYGKKFDLLTFPKNYQMETEKELIKSLINLRCDIIIGNKLTVQVLINQMGYKNKITRLKQGVSNDPLYIGFSKAKGNAQLAKQFSKTLNEFKSSTEYKDILQKYSIEFP